MPPRSNCLLGSGKLNELDPEAYLSSVLGCSYAEIGSPFLLCIHPGIGALQLDSHIRKE